jgi:hypothetical protein
VREGRDRLLGYLVSFVCPTLRFFDGLGRGCTCSLVGRKLRLKAET